jgi:hypothetical protein
MKGTNIFEHVKASKRLRVYPLLLVTFCILSASGSRRDFLGQNSGILENKSNKSLADKQNNSSEGQILKQKPTLAHSLRNIRKNDNSKISSLVSFDYYGTLNCIFEVDRYYFDNLKSDWFTIYLWDVSCETNCSGETDPSNYEIILYENGIEKGTSTNSGCNNEYISYYGSGGDYSISVICVKGGHDSNEYNLWGWHPDPDSDPDLIVQSITPSNSSPNVGDLITVDVTIKNQGTGNASGTFYIDLFKNESSCPSSGTRLWWWEETFLAAGATRIFTTPNIPYETPPTWNMYAVVDINDFIVETNENNNCLGPEIVTWNTPPGFYESDYTPTDPWSGWWWPKTPSSSVYNLFDLPPELYQPMKRYDDYFNQGTLARDWEYAKHKSTIPWKGHCESWAASSYLETEPITSVGREPFTIGDLKGLLAECNDRAVDYWEDYWTPAWDPYWFWEALNTCIGIPDNPDEHPSIMNLSTNSSETWRYPVYRYVMDCDYQGPGDLYDCNTTIRFANYFSDPSRVGNTYLTKGYNFTIDIVGNVPQPGGTWISDLPVYNALLTLRSEKGNEKIDCVEIRKIIQNGTGIMEDESISISPKVKTSLSQNSPNPFYSSTVIRYTLTEKVQTSLRIYDVSGRVVRTLIDDEVERPGFYKIDWDGKGDKGEELSSGIYFYRLEAGDFRQTKKLIFVR